VSSSSVAISRLHDQTHNGLRPASLWERIKGLAIVKINPRRLYGPWDVGYALDKHTVSSIFLGNNEHGHAEFETTRSDVGELLYRLKYRHDRAAIEPLAETAANFLRNNMELPIDLIIPAPPSTPRAIQPVKVVAEILANRLGIPISAGLKKNWKRGQLKDVKDYDKRREMLVGAFSVHTRTTAGKNVLLFDDVFGSGATTSYITETLKRQGEAEAVYLLTLTTK
jgi:predicted amidophosphoribosyltransferase